MQGFIEKRAVSRILDHFRLQAILLIILGATFYSFPAVAQTADENHSRLRQIDNFNVEEEMIFEVRLDNHIVLERSMFAYCRDDRNFLPLTMVCQLLEFPISVNAMNGTASGWFLNEKRKFALDLTNKIVISDQLREKIEDENFCRTQNEIYITDSCLTKWFPIVLEVNRRNLVINVKSFERLPIMQRFERDMRWANVHKVEAKPLLPLARQTYQLFSPPSAELTLGYQANRRNVVDETGFYTLAFANDFLFHTTTLYLSGKTDTGLTSSRMRMDWIDENQDSQNQHGIYTYSIGDVTPPFQSTLPMTRNGRGIYFSNEPFNYSSEFGGTNISGNLPKGWSAELYRGQSLIATLAADHAKSDMYFFENVPIVIGENDFIVRLYGPFGEIREERHRLFVDSGMAAPGKTYYKAYLLQNRNLLPYGEMNANQEEGYTLRTETSTGLSRRLTLKHDLLGTFSGNDKEFFSALEALGTIQNRGIFPSLHGSVGMISRIDGGNAFVVKARSNLPEFNFSNESLCFTPGFYSDRDTAEAEWQNTLNISGRFFPGHNFTYKWLHQTLDNHRVLDNMNLNLSNQFSRLTVMNSLDYQKESGSNSDLETQFSGNTEIRARAGNTGELSAGFDYNIKPDFSLRSIGIGARWQGESSTSFSAQLRRNLEFSGWEKPNTSIDVGFMKKFAEVSSGLQISCNDLGDWQTMITLNSSFALMPDYNKVEASCESMVRSGGVIVRVALRNEKGDEPLPGIKILAGGHRQTTDENGIAIIKGLLSGRRIDIAVEPVSLVDPFIIMENPGVSIIPRPGFLHRLDYFAVMTSEVEGHVLYEDEGISRPVGGIQLELINKENGKLCSKTRSDGMGFYLFDFVRPGKYYIDITEKQSENLKVKVQQRKNIEIGFTGRIISDFNLVLTDWTGTEIALKPPNLDRTPVNTKQTDSQVCLASASKQMTLTLEPAISSPIAGRMIFVPGGTFQRNENIADCSIVSSFYICETELTKGQLALISALPPVNSQQANLPAEKISWYDALVICNRLSLKEGLTPVYSINGRKDPEHWGLVPDSNNSEWNQAECDWKADGYRLPTEMEWMWAGMGAKCGVLGSVNTHGWFRTFAGACTRNQAEDFAWFWQNSGEISRPVKSLKPNELGIYDMSGNVSEWCWDKFSGIPPGLLCNFSGLKNGFDRVERGGSYFFGKNQLAIGKRSSCSPFLRQPSQGLRLIRSSGQKSPLLDLTDRPCDERTKKFFSPYVGELVYVPGGLYQRDANSQNISRVDGFHMTKFEISTAQYARVNCLPHSKETNEWPVHNISWYDALAFCNRASLLENLEPAYNVNGSTDPDDWGDLNSFINRNKITLSCNWKASGYRLPTESEWMWAAMGADYMMRTKVNEDGYKKPYSGSAFPGYVDDFAVYWGNSNEIKQVDNKKANEIGLFNMSGNVSEWCWDRFEEYPKGELINYHGPETGEKRIERGGSYFYGPVHLRIRSRSSCEPYLKKDSIGFRVVRP